MELQQIRYFLSIDEHGSFSRAASECAVSQPVLTASMTSTPEPLADQFRSETLYREPYVVAFAPGNALGRFEKVRLADVNGEPYVDRLARELREIVMALARQSGVKPLCC